MQMTQTIEPTRRISFPLDDTVAVTAPSPVIMRIFSERAWREGTGDEIYHPPSDDILPLATLIDISGNHGGRRLLQRAADTV